MPVQRPTTTRLRRSLFEEAVAIVEREYADDLALDDIARRVATSRRQLQRASADLARRAATPRRQLQRAYAEVGDTTFREHLTKIRMERAGELLLRGGMT